MTARCALLPAAVLMALPVCHFAAAQDAPTARLEGRVTNTAGKAVSHATIALVGNHGSPSSPLAPAYRTTSNADGGFVIDDIEPNTYRIFAQRAGYLDFVYVQTDGKVAVPIADGQRVRIEVKMTAPSFLSGRITNEEGEPFPDARVNVVRVTRMGGKRRLAALSPVSAGPDGSFSIGRLTAGRYYLAASNPPSLADTNGREIHHGQAGDERYVTTYYPSSIDTSGATLIELAGETEIHGLDIHLRRSRVFHIAGKVVAPAGGPAAAPTITLLRPGLTEMADPQSSADRVYALDGVFQVNGLLPGAYAFHAWSGPNRQLQGHVSVVLSDRDLDDVTLTLVPALDIPLTVRIEDADPQQAQKIAKELGRFTLTASDGVNTNAMAQGKDDGTWVFHSIGQGTYYMGLGGPDGTYVKSIRYGDRDVTRCQLDTTTGGGSLAMVLSPHAAEVAGVVNDATGQPLAGVTVTLWTPGMPPAGMVDSAESTRTDDAGRFRFGRLAPGEYRMAAWEKIDPYLPNVSEFHQKFDGEATAVRLTENAREKVQPVLIGRQKIEAAAATLQ